MATCTLLTARLKRAIGTAGFASTYTDADLMAQFNSSMLTIARRVKLKALCASGLVYTNTQTVTTFANAGGTTTVTGDMVIDYNPTAGADAKVIVVTIDGTGSTFAWTLGGVSQATGVAITGLSQTLYKKISITFGATSGFDVGAAWTFTAYADLPSDYHYGLVRADRTATTNPITVLASYQELLEFCPLMSRSTGYWGNPTYAAIGEQKQLFIGPCPSTSETIRIFYQKKPTAFTAGSDVDLTAMGDEYQYGALVYHSAKEILDDGGQSELAARMENRYEREMGNLLIEEGVNDDPIETIRDENLYT